MNKVYWLNIWQRPKNYFRINLPSNKKQGLGIYIILNVGSGKYKVYGTKCGII